MEPRGKFTSGWSIALSVLLIVVGLLDIALPGLVGLAVNRVVAWLLVAGGIAHIGYAWNRRYAGGVVWQFLVGVIYISVGIYLLTHPLQGLLALSFLLAAYLFVQSILELVIALRLRPLAGWPWLLGNAVVTFILAALIWARWPLSSEWAIGTLVGVNLLFGGLSRLLLLLTARHVAHRPQVARAV